MTLLLTCGVWVFCLIPAQAEDLQTPIAQYDPARIWVENGSLHYFGAMSQPSLDAFRKITADLDTTKIDRFVVNSGGGETTVGRSLGRWIFSHGLDVEVVAVCFSSCANYVFPAGRRKFINADAFVGWHGSETEYEIIALNEPEKSGEDLEREALADALRPVMPEGTTSAQMGAAVNTQIANANKSRADEYAFFQMLHLDREYTIHGLRPKNFTRFRTSGRAGWTYSIDDMTKLGLKNIEFLSTGAYVESAWVLENGVIMPYDPELIEN